MVFFEVANLARLGFRVIVSILYCVIYLLFRFVYCTTSLYVPSKAGIPIGIISGLAAYFGGKLIKRTINIDDVLDVASLQAVWSFSFQFYRTLEITVGFWVWVPL